MQFREFILIARRSLLFRVGFGGLLCAYLFIASFILLISMTGKLVSQCHGIKLVESRYNIISHLTLKWDLQWLVIST